MATVRMKSLAQCFHPVGTAISAYGYGGIVDSDGFAVVDVPAELADGEAASGRLVPVDDVKTEAKGKAKVKA